ncbi:MAG TPA: FHA domain-containing protein [Streptosporangiaceae bacterium]|jgi:DNA-directed RNA polymerase subunit RPC12/RpoP|nr:FHA domain-containing protein [Streptosporangiaceae bacterium]
MASLSCPDCGVTVQPEDLICFRCGANLPYPDGPDDDVPTPTVSQQFIRPGADARCPRCGAPAPDPADVICPRCGEPLTSGVRRISPVVMRITFPTGNVDIPAGTSVLLGRDPAESLVAAAFSRFDNVSRRHATVKVDDFGHATIRDENSTNGTYVNDDRVLPGTEVRLVDGDRVRLAADVTGSVSLPQAEPDPSGLSRNGRY